MSAIQRPIHRSRLRLMLGKACYTTARRLWWQFGGTKFASKRTKTPLPVVQAAHSTPLLRQLRDVDMQLQYNKIVNLKLAVSHLDGLLLRPGETLSYWRCIGKPTARRGYLEGMVLFCGTFRAEVGGGLCQLSNLIYWMTLHTPLTVTERYRHSFDVFPDANRTQPFGSGATCVYNYRDLMIRNDTQQTFRLSLRVTEQDLEGEWRGERPLEHRYEIEERNHRMELEPWGQYSRHNQLWRLVWRPDGTLAQQTLVAENHALMMYQPFLPPGEKRL